MGDLVIFRLAAEVSRREEVQFSQSGDARDCGVKVKVLSLASIVPA